MGNDLLKKGKEKLVYLKIVFKGKNSFKNFCVLILYDVGFKLQMDVVDYFCDVVNVFKFLGSLVIKERDVKILEFDVLSCFFGNFFMDVKQWINEWLG